MNFYFKKFKKCLSTRETALWLWNRYFELWPYLFCATAHIFATGSHSVALSWLQATKTRSKLPRSQFSPKRRLFLNVYRPFHQYDPSHISLRFRVTAQRVKKIRLSFCQYVKALEQNHLPWVCWRKSHLKAPWDASWKSVNMMWLYCFLPTALWFNKDFFVRTPHFQQVSEQPQH